jgi:hypothetical protein
LWQNCSYFQPAVAVDGSSCRMCRSAFPLTAPKKSPGRVQALCAFLTLCRCRWCGSWCVALAVSVLQNGASKQKSQVLVQEHVPKVKVSTV